MMMSEEPTCPICGSRHESRTDLRVHLMTDHRKSAVTDELLKTVEGRETAAPMP